MVSPRILAQLADVALRDARAAVDPHETDNLSDLAEAREITIEDVGASVHLVAVHERLWREAATSGWCPVDSPWLSDEENEEIRCKTWDRVLP